MHYWFFRIWTFIKIRSRVRTRFTYLFKGESLSIFHFCFLVCLIFICTQKLSLVPSSKYGFKASKYICFDEADVALWNLHSKLRLDCLFFSFAFPILLKTSTASFGSLYPAIFTAIGLPPVRIWIAVSLVITFASSTVANRLEFSRFRIIFGVWNRLAEILCVYQLNFEFVH